MVSEELGCQAQICNSEDIDCIPDLSTDLHSKPRQFTCSVFFSKTKENL